VAVAKRIGHRVLDAVGARLASVQVALACRRARGDRLVVLDVDNTLADTWPTLTRTWPAERARLDAIHALPNIKAVAHDAAVERGATVLFVSRRSWRRWGQTVRWLRRNGFAATRANVVLVAHPADKLALLRRCARAAAVTYWDDLSHGHELGEVVFYDDVIAAVRSMPLGYRGWDDIRAVVEGQAR